MAKIKANLVFVSGVLVFEQRDFDSSELSDGKLQRWKILPSQTTKPLQPLLNPWVFIEFIVGHASFVLVCTRADPV